MVQRASLVMFQKIKDQILVELAAQKLNAILLVPVLVAFGIGFYFSLSFEPVSLLTISVFLSSVFCVFFSRSWPRLLMFGVFCMVLGFGAAQMRTSYVHTPMILKKLDFVDVQGRITFIEELDKGVRLTLSDVIIEDLEGDETPRKIRLKLWKPDGIEVGQTVAGLASLNPPSPPVIPHGFDFQRYMYFRGIGAVGFFYKTPDIIDGSQSGHFVERLRYGIGERIGAALGKEQSGLARALMIGQRSSIEEDDLEAIRAAGLAHMLAISGLHVGLFSGVIFFFIRFLMALFPSFALKHPIKKYAAIVAIMAAFFYMLVAGATIPTQRAMITVAVVFTAILLDRSPISLRVVGFAALCVLLIIPESLLSASFQMSFAAVTGLIAFYDWTRPLWSKWARQAGWIKRLGLYLLGVITTTLIATIATAPLTLFHFQALPVYGVLANVICVPLLAFVVMPLAILSFLLMPLGLEGYALSLMGPALSVFLELAHRVSDIEGAVFHVPSFTSMALVFLILTCLSIVIFKARLRIIASITMGVCALFNFKWIQYDVLVSSKLDLIALQTHEPYLIVSDKRKSKFMHSNWKQSLGLEETESVRFPKEGSLQGENYSLNCDVSACRYEAYEG